MIKKRKPSSDTVRGLLSYSFLNLVPSSFINKRKVKFMRESEKNSKASKQLYESATKYFIKENFDKSMVFVNKAIRKDPQNPDFYVLRAGICLAQSNPPNAIENYSKAMLLGLRDENIYCSRGYAYQQLGKTQNALCDYNLALEINPKYSPALSQRGIIFMELKNYTNAIKDFDAVLEMEPNDYRSLINKCSVYKQCGESLTALEVINAFVSSRKNHVPAEIIMEKGFLNSECGFHQNAIKDFTKLILEAKYFKHSYEWRANEYEKIGELNKAKADRDKVIELDRFNSDIDYV